MRSCCLLYIIDWRARRLFIGLRVIQIIQNWWYKLAFLPPALGNADIVPSLCGRVWKWGNTTSQLGLFQSLYHCPVLIACSLQNWTVVKDLDVRLLGHYSYVMGTSICIRKLVSQLTLCILLRNSHKSSLFLGRQLVSVGVRRRSMCAV